MPNTFLEKIKAEPSYENIRNGFDELIEQGQTSTEALDHIMKLKELDSHFTSEDKIQLLGALLQTSLEQIKIKRTRKESEEKNFMLEVLSRFGTELKSDSFHSDVKIKAVKLFEDLTDKLKKYFDPEAIELERIIAGIDQNQFNHFTYVLSLGHQWAGGGKKGIFAHKEATVSALVGAYVGPMGYFADFHVYPVMDRPGMRCTAALPAELPNSGPIELQLNFFGTIDWASKAADMDSGGPGQKTLKAHEKNLLKNLDDMIEHLSERYPDRPINLRINGHSLGGSLAKGFAHCIQRALAIQDKKPDEVVNIIATHLDRKAQEQNSCDDKQRMAEDAPKYKSAETPNDLLNLKNQLEKDKTNFLGMKGLQKLNKVTVYALGSPGVSAKTDDNATLLTYFHEPNFLTVYNHFHEKDLIVKFGEQEFLSGRKITPNIAINKNIIFKVEVAEDEIAIAGTLPFPGISKEVMAVHNKRIADHNPHNPIYPPNNWIRTAVSDAHSAKSPAHEKFHFHPVRVFLLTIAIKLVAAIVNLFSTNKELRAVDHLKRSIFNEKKDSSTAKNSLDSGVMWKRFKSVVQESKLDEERLEQKDQSPRPKS